jgi:hypothetical protein
VHYCEPGFSLSVRSNDSLFFAVKGLVNIARHFVLDKGMNRLLGDKWLAWKTQKAHERANRTLVNLA